MLPKQAVSIPLVIQQTSSVRALVIQWCEDVGLGQTKTTGLHGFVKRGTLSTVGIDDEHLRMVCGMALNEARELLGVVALIQHIAADDQIELPKRGVVPGPVALGISHGWQIIESQIGLQKTLDIRMNIRSRDIAQAPVNHQTRQSQAAAYFQDAQTLELPGLHQVGHFLSRRPDQAKQRPSGRSHAKRQCKAVRVVELLFVQQRADVQCSATSDCHTFLFDEIAQSGVGRAGFQNRRLRGPLGPFPSM